MKAPPLGTLENCLLVVARAQIGRGESRGNNRGPDLVEFRRGMDDESPWCAAFVSYCYEEAALLLGQPLPRPLVRRHGAKRLGDLIEAAGQKLTVPEPGAVAVWHRGLAGSWMGHIGIVEEYDPDTDTMVAIEGNRGAFPAVVTRFKYPLGKWREGLEGLATTRKYPNDLDPPASQPS